MIKQLSKKEADILYDEYEEYCNRDTKWNGEKRINHLPFVIWLKYKKKITNFPWGLYKEEE